MRRYELTLSNEYEPRAVMEEDKDGEYVKYREYQILTKRIAKLEKDKEFLLSQRFMGNTIFTNQGLNDAIAKHNLIQQAKGIEDALGDYDVSLELLAGDKFYKKALTNRVRKLREQAKS